MSNQHSPFCLGIGCHPGIGDACKFCLGFVKILWLRLDPGNHFSIPLNNVRLIRSDKTTIWHPVVHPIREIILPLFQLVLHAINADQFTPGMMPAQRFPETRAEIKGVVSTLGLNEHIGIQHKVHPMDHD
nr:hypothetical protein [Thiolapillus sp.]